MFIDNIVMMRYIAVGCLPNYPYHCISTKEMLDAFLSYSVTIGKEEALTLKIGTDTLWEDPKKFTVLYSLRSYEYNDDTIVISGNKSMMDSFMNAIDTSEEMYMNPNCWFYQNYPCMYSSMKDKYDTLVSGISYHVDEYYSDSSYQLPDWVYSYMLGAVIGPYSDQQDIHDYLVLMNLDNINDVFTEEVCSFGYSVSEKWIQKLPPAKRTMRPATFFGEPHIIKSLRIAGQL